MSEKSHVLVSFNISIDADDNGTSFSADSFIIKVPLYPLQSSGELTEFQKCIQSIVSEHIVELRIQLNKAKKYKTNSFNVLGEHILRAYEQSLDKRDRQDAKKAKTEETNVPVADTLHHLHFCSSRNRSRTSYLSYKKCLPLTVTAPDIFLSVFAEME